MAQSTDRFPQTTSLKLVWIGLLMMLVQAVDAQSLVWANHFGGTTLDLARDIMVDNAGNVYAVGAFSDTVDFDPGPGVFTLQGNGFLNIFVAKFDAAGNLIWAINIGSSGNDQPMDLTMDAAGNLFVSGFFTGTVDFDPGPGVFNLTGQQPGWDTAFLMKLSNSGNLIWATSFNGLGGIAYESALDGSGNILVSGHFVYTANFGPVIFNSIGNTIDAFVAKLDPSGNVIWAKQLGGLGIDRAYGMGTDAHSNVYIGGQLTATGDFDPNAGVSNLALLGVVDGYLCKLDSMGNFVWAENFGAPGANVVAWAVAVEPSGAPLMAGSFTSVIDFDPGAGTQLLSSAGNNDAFIAKFDAMGNHRWANRFGGDSIDITERIEVDDQGNVYATGRFMHGGDIDPGPALDSLISNGSLDVFVEKLDSNGNLLAAFSLGGPERDVGFGIFGKGGQIYACGTFSDTVDFDPGVGVSDISSAGQRDAWLGKFSLCQSSDTTLTISACNGYVAPSGAVFTASGTYMDVIENASRCDSLITLQLSITTLNAAIAQNGDTLSASQNGATYQWLDCDNGYAPLNGATAQDFIPSVSGSYAVQVTQGACADTSGCIPVSIVSQATGADGQVSAYPNPTDGFVYVVAGPGIEPSTIQVWNCHGQRVLIVQPSAHGPTLLELPRIPGIYCLELIETNGARINKKIVLR